jgi:endonuclease YncB( thermonuclease family)
VRAPVEPPAENVTFLIALKDSSVYTAVAYWVEGDTLHYITPQGRHNQVSLELVDRALSEKLNQGRKVEFKLPTSGKK